MTADLSLRRNVRDLFVRAFLAGFWGWAILAIMGVNRNLPQPVAAAAGILAWFWAAFWIGYTVNWLASRLELRGERLTRRSLVRSRSVDLAALDRAGLDPDRSYADDSSYGRSRVFNSAPDVVLTDRSGGEVRIGLGGEWLGARPLFVRLLDHLRRPDVTVDERTLTNVTFVAGVAARRE